MSTLPPIPKMKLYTVSVLDTKHTTVKACIYYRELEATGLGSGCRIHGTPPLPPLCQEDGFLAPGLSEETASPLCRHLHHWHNCPELHKAIDGIKFIADHTKREEDSTRVCMLVGNKICPVSELTCVIKLISSTPFQYLSISSCRKLIVTFSNNLCLATGWFRSH